MRTPRILTLTCAALLAAAMAAPASAGNGYRGGEGSGQGQTVRTQTQQRLRDGSCQQTQVGLAAQNRARFQARSAAGGTAGARLRDGSCLSAPTPAPSSESPAPSE